jgi:integrase
MAGSVMKDNKTGKYYYVLELGKDSNGKRIQKKKRGFKTKKDAKAALAEAETQLNNGTYISPSNMTYGEYLEVWFKSKKNNINIQTEKVYDFYLSKFILPGLGKVKLNDLKFMQIQSYINELGEDDLSSETIRKIHSIVHSSLETAIDMELLVKNPSNKIILPKRESLELKVWNEQEISSFLNIAKRDRYFIVYHLGLSTGMRRGEILGLRWKDIDLDKRELQVKQTLSKDGKMFLPKPKTKASRRIINLPEKTIQSLKKLKRRAENEKKLAGGSYTDYDLVVCTQLGTPLNPSNLRRSFNRLIKSADVPSIRFHDLRHTHSTMLISKGVNIKVVSERLGHSSIRVTLDVYSHVLPTMQDEAVRQIDLLLD